MLRRLVMSLMLEMTQAVWILLLGLGNQALSSEFVKRFPLAYNMGFLCGSDGKESAYSAGDLGSIPELERSPGEGNGNATPVFLPGECHGQRWAPVLGSQRVRHDWATITFTSFACNTDCSTQDSALWISTASITKRHFPFLPKRSLHVIRATWVCDSPRQGLRRGQWLGSCAFEGLHHALAATPHSCWPLQPYGCFFF